MRLRVLGGYGGQGPSGYLTSFLINDSVVLDAGSISYALNLEEQVKIKHIVISHSHFDHITGLPFFIDNLFGLNTSSVNLYGHRPTLEAIKNHLFNNQTWPDFSKIISNTFPLLAYHEIEARTPFAIDGLKVTGIQVNHIVPTLGFSIEEEGGGSAIIYTADTYETEAIWEAANSLDRLKAVIVETSFPNSMSELARVSRHLTPDLLRQELTKLKKDVPIFVSHLKPTHIKIIVEELKEIKGWHITHLEQGMVFEF